MGGTWADEECRDGGGCCWRFTRWHGKGKFFHVGNMMVNLGGDVEMLGTDGVAWEMRRTRRGWGGVGFGEKGRRKGVEHERGEGRDSCGVLCGLGVLCGCGCWGDRGTLVLCLEISWRVNKLIGVRNWGRHGVGVGTGGSARWAGTKVAKLFHE